MTHPALDALRRDIAGRVKLVAAECWPSISQHSSESRLSRVLAGELAIPAELLDQAVHGGVGATIAYLQARAAGDPAELRKEALETLRRVEQQLSLAFDRLDEANHAEERELERPGPVRVQPKAGAKRWRA